MYAAAPSEVGNVATCWNALSGLSGDLQLLSMRMAMSPGGCQRLEE